MVVRPEAEGDEAGIRSVVAAAFDTDAEAGLVDAIRVSGTPQIALVAEEEGRIVGHILFSEARVGDATVAALAPMAVLPDRQNVGIGSRLVKAGLDLCREAGYPGVVVLGHAAYYPRFGFTPARAEGIECPYDVADESWMVRELTPDTLDAISGTVEYHEAFAAL